MRGSEQYRALMGEPTLREKLVRALRVPRPAFAVASAIISLFWLRIPKAVVATEEPGAVPAQ